MIVVAPMLMELAGTAQMAAGLGCSQRFGGKALGSASRHSPVGPLGSPHRDSLYFIGVSRGTGQTGRLGRGRLASSLPSRHHRYHVPLPYLQSLLIRAYPASLPPGLRS